MRHVLPSISVPTLVLHRAGDALVPVAAGRELSQQIPGAKYVEIPGDDHLVLDQETQDIIADEIEEFMTGARHHPEPDRVLATVMFTDVAKSTERAAELGDERWRELLNQYYEVVRKELAAFRGREVNTAGDGLLATFDGPARAIRCAVSAREKLRSLGLEVRTGLHTGECETDRRRYRRHRGAHCLAHRDRSESRRGDGVEHRKGFSGRLGNSVWRSGNAQPEGRPRKMASVRSAVALYSIRFRCVDDFARDRLLETHAPEDRNLSLSRANIPAWTPQPRHVASTSFTMMPAIPTPRLSTCRIANLVAAGIRRRCARRDWDALSACPTGRFRAMREAHEMPA